ncbi:LOG family protein [Oceanobacter kriegii]|uniref:LOG family protein n=1 Tax=Oceanobacter kriegii TaxID=64972 RepID=UPI000561E139|nr:TIGR00730 family Rossman fold protein [Oceanobacter kriegii]
MIKRVAIYCGSRMGNDPQFAEAAAALSGYLAKQGVGIVYGGSSAGLMGIVADAALAEGGDVIGVMPDNLWIQERAHKGLTQLEFVSGMHQRKARMVELADAFIALPGGIGTLDEMVEVLCWSNIGDHNKPCVCFDVNNFWQPFFTLMEHIQQQDFAHHQVPLLKATQPAELLTLLNEHAAA